MNYYKHHIGDYRRDTAHLSLLEHGIYRQLMDTYYLSEEPIQSETEQVMRRLSARTEEERTAVKLVLGEFFSLVDGVWKHARCDQEIEAYHKRAEASATNGKLGGRPVKKPRKTKTVPNQKATTNQEPLTINHIPPVGPQGGCARFEDFWSAWPANERKHDKVKCARKWRQDALDVVADAILSDISTKRLTRKWQEDGGKFVEAPLVYLNGRRWEDGAGAEPARQESFV